MNNFVDLSFKYNQFGVGECHQEANAKIDPGLKLKIEDLVHKIIEDMPPSAEIRSIKINRDRDTVCLLINEQEVNLLADKKRGGILTLAQEIFRDPSTAACAKMSIHMPNPIDAVANPIKPGILSSPTQISDSLLAHILAGEFGAGSELQGGSNLVSLEYVKNFFLSRKRTSLPYGIQPSLMQNIERAIRYSGHRSNPQEIQKEIIEALQFKQPLLLPGGWIGAPHGHSLYYEILPRDDGKVNVRLYNLGGGVESFSRVVVGKKAKANPVVEWQGITHDNLLNPAFSTVLSELSHLLNVDNYYNTDFSGKDIYHSLKEMLEPEAEAFLYESWQPMTLQRGGWCSWKSLMIYLRTQMSENNYKIFKADIKLQALIDNYNNGRGGSLSAQARWRLINKALSSVARSVDKLYVAGLVGEDYIKQSHALLKPIFEWVKQNKSRVHRVPADGIKGNVAFVSLDQSPENRVWNRGQGLLSTSVSLADSEGADEIGTQKLGNLLKLLEEQMHLMQTSSPSQNVYSECFKRLLPAVEKAWMEERDYESHMALNLWINSLSIDINIWKDLYGHQPDKTKQMIMHLSELQRLYIKTCWTVPQSEVVHPECILNAYKIMFIQCHLAQILIPEQLWSEIEPSGSDFDRFLNPAGNHSMFYFRYFNEKQNAEFMQIAHWYNHRTEFPLNGKQSSLTAGNLASEYDFAFTDNGQSLVDKIVAMFPDLIQRVAKSVPNFKALKKGERDAHVLLSPYLPDWLFKGIIESCILANSLTRQQVYHIAHLDRGRDLNLERTREGSKITFQLTGVTTPKVVQNTFKKYYAPFKSPKLNKFINGMVSWDSAVNERFLLGHKDRSQMNAKEREEYQELAYVNMSPDLCVPSAMSLFQRNPQLLFDPDYRQLLEMMIFQPGYFQKAMKWEGFAEKYTRFIEEGVAKCLRDNQITATVFLARMARYFKQLGGADVKLEEYQLPLLRKLLQFEGLDDTQKGAIYSEICAALSLKEELDEEDIHDTLKGSVFVNRHPLPVNMTNEYVKREGVWNIYKHAVQLEKALVVNGEANQRLLNDILKAINPQAEEVVWAIKRKPGEFPLFYSVQGDYEFYALKGELVFPGATVTLPYTLKEHVLFKKIFPGVEKGVQLAGNVYAFKDPIKGYDTRLSIQEGDLIIDQLRKEPTLRWYRYVPHESLELEDRSNAYSPLYSRFLVEGQYHAWLVIDPDQSKRVLHLVDPITNSAKYEAYLEKSAGGLKVSKLLKCNSRMELGSSKGWMQVVEEPQYVHAWYQNQKLLEIELPRFNLSFKAGSKKTLKLYSEQFPGFYVQFDAVLKKAGAYRHYLVMQDDHGNKKALFPLHHFLSLSEKKEVFEPRYTIDMEVKSAKPQRYFVFEVMKNGKLFSKSREANLYLAEVFLLIHDYKQAAALLKRHGKKMREYSQAEIDILKKISDMHKVTGNEEGNAIGIQTYASYMLEKNFRDYPPDKKEETSLAENYRMYLDHFNAVRVLRLSLDEEQYVLRNLKQTSLSMAHRRIELEYPSDREGSKLLPAYTQKPFKEQVYDLSQLNFNDYPPWEYSENSINISSLTRMERKLDRAPRVALYKVLTEMQDPVWKSYYKAGLIFWKNSAKNRNDSLKAYFFSLVLNHSYDFPPVPADLNKDNFDRWWQSVMDVAKELAKSHPMLDLAAHATELEGGEVQIKQIEMPEIALEGLSLETVAPLKKIGLVGSPDKAWFTTLPRHPVEAGSSDNESLQQILDHLVDMTKDQRNQNDPLVEKEVQRLKQDILAFENQAKTPLYHLNSHALQEMESFYQHVALSEGNSTHNFACQLLEREILSIANKLPVTTFGQARKELLEWGGQQRPFKLGELVVNFAKLDARGLKERNPALFPADIKAIYEKLGLYLQLQTQKQQAQRVLNKITELKALYAQPQQDIDKIHTLVQALAAEATASRCYSIDRYPAFLVFEFIEGILLKPVQVQMIADFLDNKDVQAIRELIMGSGKSKVLLPLLAYLRADGKHLSTLIVPEALHPSVSSDTQEKLREAFGIDLHTMEFHRNTEFSRENLENILAELHSIRDRKESLIITSRSIHCLMLKFIEKSIEHFTSAAKVEPTHPELRIMREILSLLSADSYPLLDEADLLLNVLHEVSFSIGQRHAPLAQDMEVIADVYRIIYTDPHIKKLARVESDPYGDAKAPLLSEDLYRTTVKPRLAEAFIEKMKKKEYHDKVLQQKVNRFFSGLNSADMGMLLDYLCRTPEKVKTSQAYYDSQPQEIREILALAGEEISNLLPHSLLKSCDEKYGVDREQGGILAIPFSSANTPSRGSEFANHHITMNYTLQNYVQKGIPREILIGQMQALQENARREIIENAQEISLQKTKAWHLFCKIKGDLNIPFFNLTEAHIKMLLDEINRNPETRLNMVQQLILPLIEIYDKKISSNSHNLASFYKIIWGFTGSLWNSSSMSRKLTPMTTQGTDALTLTALCKNSYKAVRLGFSGSSKDMMSQLLKTGVDFDVLIDSGGYFKEIDNVGNARLLSSHLHKPMVFYDHRGDQAVIDPSGSKTLFAESPLKNQDALRGTFLDQAHTTGADVPQKPMAVGMVTIGMEMLCRDLLQSVWRMRGLDKAQRVEFMISKNVEILMRQVLKKRDADPITFGDILGFTIYNQAKRLGKDNFKAFRAEIQDVVQQTLLEILMNPHSTLKECAQAVQELGSSWLKSSFAPADNLYGQLPIEDASEVICENIIESSVAKLKASPLTLGKVQEMQKIKDHFKGKLSRVVSTQVGNQDLTTEQQKIAEKHAELEVIASASSSNVDQGEIIENPELKQFRAVKFSPDLYPKEIRGCPSITSSDETLLSLGTFPLPVFSFKTFFVEYEDLKMYADFFEGINLSLGMLQIPDKKDIDLP